MPDQIELIKKIEQEKGLTPNQIYEYRKLAESSGKTLERILVEKKVISQEELAQMVALMYNFPYVDLRDAQIDDKTLKIISSQVAENYKIICFERNKDEIKVGIIDPNDFKAMEAVDFLSKEGGLHPTYYIISNDSFDSAFKKYETLAKELSSALKKREEELKKEEAKRKLIEKKVNLDEVMKSAPVIKIVSVILRHAIDGGASDIHIEPLENESRVRYRIDGILHTSLVLPKNIHNAVVARIKVMSNLKLDETRIPQDGRIRIRINDKDIDFRISILPLLDTEKVVMRILDTSKGAPTLKGLGYEGIQISVIEKNIKKTEGLLLVTGPTGSGKSTTLFSIISMLNTERVNISTLEDPIEYEVEGVNQSQIKPEIGYTFATGLRSFLRQDPNIIMVGEIRDEETAELAIHSALTGHLVLSTLHTMDALGSLGRLLDMHVEPFLLGSTLNTVVAQRLARRICSFCRETVKIPDEYRKEVIYEINQTGNYINTVIPDFNINKIEFFKGKGCPHCGGSGYAGRVAIVEVLDVNETIRNYIQESQKHISIKEVRETQTFITMRQDGIIKVLQGFTTMEEVIRVMEK